MGPLLTRRFDLDPRSVAEARAFIRGCLEDLAPSARMDVDLVLMAANEIVTNAVLHGRTDFEVRVGMDDGRIRVEVADLNTRLPQPCYASTSATSGRGLALVDGSGLLWGVDREAEGKSVWLLVDTG